MIALPSSRESEDAILSILVARPDRIDDAPDLSEGMFYHPGNRVIFAAIRRMRDNGTAIDSVVLMSSLMAAGNLERAGGAGRIVGVIMPDTAPEHFAEYLATIRDCHMRRTAIVRLTELLGDAERAEDYKEIEDRIESGLSALVGMAHGGEDDPTMRETVAAVVAELESRYNRDSRAYVSTGIRALDAAIGGLAGGKVYVIAGMPSDGKSALAMTIARNLASASVPVGIFSLEMPREEIVERWFAAAARVDGERMRDGSLTVGDLTRIANEIPAMESLPVHIDDSADMTIERIRGRARAWKAKRGIGLVVTDYIQLVATAKGENRELGISLISKGHKQMAKELDIPVILLSQLNDDGKLRESRAIGQDADVVLRIDGEDLSIVKQRGGRRGMEVALRFDAPHCRWCDKF